MVAPDPINHWIVLLDIEDFSLRPETYQATLSDEMYQVVEFALARAGLDLDQCSVQDRGDGVLILLPAATSPTTLLRELVRGLEDALADHHGKYNEDHRMRLRVGANQGLVIRRGERWAGTAINDLARLVDAGPVKATLARARRAHLVFVVSDHMYTSVVAQRYPGIDPAAYAAVDFVTKHGEPRRGWVTVPGYPAPPVPPADSGEPPRAAGHDGESSGTGDAAGTGGGADRGSPVPPPALRFGDLAHSQVAVGEGAIAINGDYVNGDKIVHDRTATSPSAAPAAPGRPGGPADPHGVDGRATAVDGS
ncbi:MULTISPECIES: hypothetical protein [unclassified Streptomyces]|uniref:hypothetical protein n=1 Tax=unclassified Streptomyces TaxID=2593676 RepID=UPI0004BF2245|nr:MULTISPECIES: hypothetical protein [unclassified Streptomyces]